MANNPPVLVDALLATIASLRDSLVAANVHAAKMERDTHKDRASIVAFLTAETKRIDDAAERVDDEDHGVTGKRLRAQASIGRTWTAQIERGDDRNGAAEPPAAASVHLALSILSARLDEIEVMAQRALMHTKGG